MNFYSDETYGESVAGVYDEWFSEYDPHAIDALAELAHGARALELGIGTGRFALPLSAKNAEVHVQVRYAWPSELDLMGPTRGLASARALE